MVAEAWLIGAITLKEIAQEAPLLSHPSPKSKDQEAPVLLALRMVPWDTMIIMSSIINDIFDRLATRASRLARISKVMMT